jgi:hypothetical protein
MVKKIKAISTKLSEIEAKLFSDYCKRKGVKPAAEIRELILAEMKISAPCHIAGNNKIVYDKEGDTFSWLVVTDRGAEIEVLKNISPAYLENLSTSISSALSLRTDLLGKKGHDSVAVPGRLMGWQK